MAIFDPETILSAFNDRGTLLLYLKALEKKLDGFEIDGSELASPVGFGGRYLMANGRGGCTWNAPALPKFYLLEFEWELMPGPGDTHLSSAILANGKTVLTVYPNGYAEADLKVTWDSVGSGKLYFTGFSYDVEAGEIYYTSCRAFYTAWDSVQNVLQPYYKDFLAGELPQYTISEYNL